MSTSCAMTPVVETTLPFLINVIAIAACPPRQPFGFSWLWCRLSPALPTLTVRTRPPRLRSLSAGDDLVVGVGATIAVELPSVAHLADLVEVEVAHDQLWFVRVAGVTHKLAARVDEVALAVEVVLAERLDADPVDGADVVHVGDRRSRLLQPPDVLGQAAVGGRRVEHDLGAVEPQDPPALGKVPVVADVDADLADGGVEDRVSARAGGEVELLPEALHLWDVLLAVLAEVGAVGVDHRGGVVVQAVLHDLVHGQHHHHAELLGDRLEALRRRAVGDLLGVAVVLRFLDLAEVRPVEELLEADDLRSLGARLAGGLLVLVDHRLLVTGPVGLQERCSHGVRHRTPMVVRRLTDRKAGPRMLAYDHGMTIQCVPRPQHLPPSQLLAARSLALPRSHSRRARR